MQIYPRIKRANGKARLEPILEFQTVEDKKNKKKQKILIKIFGLGSRKPENE